jgi:hypothetical protein
MEEAGLLIEPLTERVADEIIVISERKKSLSLIAINACELVKDNIYTVNKNKYDEFKKGIIEKDLTTEKEKLINE